MFAEITLLYVENIVYRNVLYYIAILKLAGHIFKLKIYFRKLSIKTIKEIERDI